MNSKASLRLKLVLALTVTILVSVFLISTISADVTDNSMVDVIIQCNNSDVPCSDQILALLQQAQPPGLSAASSVKSQAIENYPLINGAHMKVTQLQLAVIEKSMYVEKDELKYQALINFSVPHINANNAWFSTNGINGTGVKVCIVDSGIDFDHNNLPQPNKSVDFTTWDWCIDNLGTGCLHSSVIGQSRTYTYYLNVTNSTIVGNWLQIGAGWGFSDNRYDIYVYYNGTLVNSTTQNVVNEAWDNADNLTNYSIAHNIIIPSTVIVKNDTTTLNSSNYTVYPNDGKIILTEPSYVGANLTINYSYR